MSLTKNNATLHVHFDDDVAIDATVNSTSNDENGRQADDAVIKDERNGTTATLNYSRDDLMKLRNSLMAKLPPKFADDDRIDEKRKEKIRMVVKPGNAAANNNNNNNNNNSNFNNFNNHFTSNKRSTLSSPSSGSDSKEKLALNPSISLLPSFALGKYRKNASDAAAAKVDGTNRESDANNINEKVPSNQERIGFQQLMAAATVPKAFNSLVEHVEQRRQRVGSGRIAESVHNGGLWNNGHRHNGAANDKDIAFHLNYGVDYRHSNNEFFDNKRPMAPNVASNNGDRVNSKAGGERDAYEWNKENNRFPQVPTRESSTEPEWVSCGPTSKNDIIELHGFDGPNADANDKLKDAASTTSTASPPARSTPTKARRDAEMPTKNDEHFNFEDFFKLELMAGNHAARGSGPSGESRFTQWFRRDSPPKKGGATALDKHGNAKASGSAQAFASSEQFFDLMQKSSHGKKFDSNLMASSTKFRSVEELEAELVAPTGAGHAQQMRQQREHRDQREQQTKAANELIEFAKLLNQMKQQQQMEEQKKLFQQQQQQQMHASSNILQQLCLLQQMNNTSFHQRERERETLMTILNICNQNRFMAPQPPQQNYHHPHQPRQGNVAQSFRQFQANISNGMPPHSPTPQELQFHTQAIMQQASYQYRRSQQYQKQQQSTAMTPPPMPNFHHNNHGPQPFRNSKPKFNQMHQAQDGFQLMAPPQSKPIFGRSASQRAGHGNLPKFQNAAKPPSTNDAIVIPTPAVQPTAAAPTSADAGNAESPAPAVIPVNGDQ